jgi:nucleoside 2-deoxyribosyltransferase
MAQPIKKLYLAGPDVFLPDAVDIGKKKRELCAQYGFIGLFPLDSEPPLSAGIPLSKAIFDGNIAMLNEADAIVANLTPSRGVSADAGTVFEVGYAFACRKKVYGYSNVRTAFIERVQKLVSGGLKAGPDRRRYAADGLAVEDFDRFDNLMIAEALLAGGAGIVLPETDDADPLRDMQAFDRCLRSIRTKASDIAHRVAAR